MASAAPRLRPSLSDPTTDQADRPSQHLGQQHHSQITEASQQRLQLGSRHPGSRGAAPPDAATSQAVELLIAGLRQHQRFNPSVTQLKQGAMTL